MKTKYMLHLLCVMAMFSPRLFGEEVDSGDLTNIFGNSIVETENTKKSSNTFFRVSDQSDKQIQYSGFSLSDEDEKRIQAVVENCRKNHKGLVLVCGLFFQEEDRLHRMIFSIEDNEGKIQILDDMIFYIEEYLDVEINHLEVHTEDQDSMSLEIALSVNYASRLFNKIDRRIEILPNSFFSVFDMSRTKTTNDGENLNLQSYALFYLVAPEK